MSAPQEYGVRLHALESQLADSEKAAAEAKRELAAARAQVSGGEI